MCDIDLMNRMPLLHKWCDDPVQSGDFLLAGRQAAPRHGDYLMRFQMSLLSVVESLEQSTLINRRTGIADIRNMDSDCANLFNEVRTMLIAAA